MGLNPICGVQHPDYDDAMPCDRRPEHAGQHHLSVQGIDMFWKAGQMVVVGAADWRTICAAPHPDRGITCGRPPDHGGMHHDVATDLTWYGGHEGPGLGRPDSLRAETPDYLATVEAGLATIDHPPGGLTELVEQTRAQVWADMAADHRRIAELEASLDELRGWAVGVRSLSDQLISQVRTLGPSGQTRTERRRRHEEHPLNRGEPEHG